MEGVTASCMQALACMQVQKSMAAAAAAAATTIEAAAAAAMTLWE